MSTHAVEVIRIDSIEPHPNADTLGLVRINGFTCAVRLGAFQPGDLAAYIEPDYIVPETPEFEFLGKHRRIKVRKLRGTYSMGLLVRAPDGASLGDNVMDVMGITRYDPEIKFQGVSMGPQMAESPHSSLGSIPKYDLESWRRYGRLLVDGEDVYVTEKLHGTNARYAWRDGRMWCGSRTQWKAQDPGCLWWRILETEPWITEWCKESPYTVLYGEVFGQVQDLQYGAAKGQTWFRAFDVLHGIEFLPSSIFHSGDGILWKTPMKRVPLVYKGPYSAELVETLAVGDSTFCPGQVAEGIVIKPREERYDARLGRVALKLVSNRYLERT